MPDGVEVTIKDGLVTVKGPKGTLSYQTLEGVEVKLEQKTLIVTVDTVDKRNLR